MIASDVSQLLARKGEAAPAVSNGFLRPPCAPAEPDGAGSRARKRAAPPALASLIQRSGRETDPQPRTTREVLERQPSDGDSALFQLFVQCHRQHAAVSGAGRVPRHQLTVRLPQDVFAALQDMKLARTATYQSLLEGAVERYLDAERTPPEHEPQLPLGA